MRCLCWEDHGKVFTKPGQGCKVTQGLSALDLWLGRSVTRCPHAHTSDRQGSWQNLQEKPLPPVLFLQRPPLRKLNMVITVKTSLKGFQSLSQSRY